MASRLQKQAVASAHTAGIYADMSNDGPEMGTLVVIVDRAKNLPNRKTMGKQDPYCAARLGKEAQKTDTDRRGGQTPKWDQELRFTVYDSLDYHKLKISVFNDDRKTDLIGEVAIDLDAVLKPGGGQSDQWHALHCKGRYAGDIRIELTYYDTRPQPEHPADTMSDTGSLPISIPETEGPGGPRTPRHLRRRPLPADPTSVIAQSRHSLPMETQPSTPSHPRGPQAMHRPLPQPAHALSHSQSFEPSRLATSPPKAQHPLPRGHRISDGALGTQQALSMDHAVNGLHEPLDESYDAVSQRHSFPTPGMPLAVDDEASNRASYHYQGIELPELPPHTPRTARSSAHASPRYYSPAEASPSSYNLPHYRNSFPNASQPDLRSTLRGSDQYSSSPLRQSLGHDDTLLATRSDGLMTEDLPPIPTHRSHGAQQTHDELHMGTESVPQSLQVGNRASRYAGRPHSLSQADISLPSLPATHDPRHRHSALPSTTARASTYDGVDMSRTFDGFAAATRPRAGSERTSTTRPAAGSERNSFASSSGHVSPMTPAGRSSIGAGGWTGGSASPLDYASHDSSPVYSRHGHSPLSQDSVPMDSADNTGAVPLARPQPIPPPRRPTRKSVSPAPGLGASPNGSTGSGSLNGVPFGPDSYDTLNPHLGSTQSVAGGSSYRSTDRSRESGSDRAHDLQPVPEVEGPIVDSRGRVVDPSDHLPTDTWAPEPERKAPRKTHEVKLRFRSSPAGGQPMGSTSSLRPMSSSGIPASRPMSSGLPSSHSMTSSLSSPHYASEDMRQWSAPVSSSSSSHGRARLQKRPPNAYATHLPPGSAPLREHAGNYNYHSAPSHAGSHSHSHIHNLYGHSHGHSHAGSMYDSSPLHAYGSHPMHHTAGVPAHVSNGPSGFQGGFHSGSGMGMGAGMSMGAGSGSGMGMGEGMRARDCGRLSEEMSKIDIGSSGRRMRTVRV